jgi:excisionase family DNA binding protein
MTIETKSQTYETNNLVSSSKRSVPHQKTEIHIESYFTIRSAAKALGLKYHSLLRAVNADTIPSYKPFGKRRLVLLSEVRAFVASCKMGGQCDD